MKLRNYEFIKLWNWEISKSEIMNSRNCEFIILGNFCNYGITKLCNYQIIKLFYDQIMKVWNFDLWNWEIFKSWYYKIMKLRI